LVLHLFSFYPNHDTIIESMIKSKKLVCDITPQLAEFLGEQPGRKKISRTDVTRRIDAYIQENRLQDVMNPTNIYPDKKLMTLLLSAFTLNPRPYPKMITFEMLRDIISNHCLNCRYEEYYYHRIPGTKSTNHDSVCEHCCDHCHQKKQYRRHRDNYNDDDDAFTFTFISCALILLSFITIAALLYKIF
jgi:chromatin remodeling complex protein RSC6